MLFKGLLLPRKLTDYWYMSLRSYATKNPYEVLGLKSNCSTKDVKKAYIKLCKELHPDKKPDDVSQHKKFIELNEAYTYLVNADNRRCFEQKISEPSTDNIFKWKHTKAADPFSKDKWERNSSEYAYEEFKQYYKQQRQNSNFPKRNHAGVLIGCFLLVVGGIILYIMAYRYAIYYTSTIVDKKSQTIHEKYQDVRKNALENGPEDHIEKMKKKWKI